jgi:DNA-binding MarR family transcriptional regulator
LVISDQSSVLHTAMLFRRAIARLNRRLRTQTRTAGLTVAKHSILGHLYRSGAATPGALAAAEGVQPQSLTRVLAELEEAGHVLRTQNEVDRRQFTLEITDEGREIVERDATRRAIWLASAMTSCLSATEQELLRLSAQLMERLADSPSDHSHADELGQEDLLMAVRHG